MDFCCNPYYKSLPLSRIFLDTRQRQNILIDNMEEILILPDVHGRQFWRPALDYPGEIIFLGDYCDPYPEEGIGVDEAHDNFLDIVEFKAENPDKVTLLIGNHELHYFDSAFKYSRKGSAYYDEMNGILTGSETKDLFKVCKLVGNYLFSHEGVSYGWYKKHLKELLKRGTNIENQLNTYFADSKMAFDETGIGRGCRDEFGCPLWADLTEIWEEEKHFNPNIFQIVGHSRLIEGAEAPINEHIACLDTKQPYLLKDDMIGLYDK